MSFKLFAGDVLIGTLSPHPTMQMDWPRYYFAFHPTPEYDRYRGMLDLKGMSKASRQQMNAGDRLDLKVESADGRVSRLKFIFLDEGERMAVIRSGLMRRDA